MYISTYHKSPETISYIIQVKTSLENDNKRLKNANITEHQNMRDTRPRAQQTNTQLFMRVLVAFVVY